jgi:hypothetical protein
MRMLDKIAMWPAARETERLVIVQPPAGAPSRRRSATATD